MRAQRTVGGSHRRQVGQRTLRAERKGREARQRAVGGRRFSLVVEARGGVEVLDPSWMRVVHLGDLRGICENKGDIQS